MEKEINVYEEANVSLADEVDSLSRTAIQGELLIFNCCRQYCCFCFLVLLLLLSDIISVSWGF